MLAAAHVVGARTAGASALAAELDPMHPDRGADEGEGDGEPGNDDDDVAEPVANDASEPTPCRYARPMARQRPETGW